MLSKHFIFEFLDQTAIDTPDGNPYGLTGWPIIPVCHGARM
jgi:hypothetical protein